MNVSDLPRPTVVCGMPRSGTSLVGQLIKSGGTGLDGLVDKSKEHVRIYPELPPSLTSAQFDLLAQVGTALRSLSWHEFSDAVIAERQMELLRSIWRTGRPMEGPPDEGHERFGLKQPLAEHFYSEYRAVLGQVAPLYVYCIRPSADVYRSNLKAMGTWRDSTPALFGKRYGASLTAVEAMVDEDVFVVDVDAVSTDAALRHQVTRALFLFLGIEFTHRTEGFVDAWPAINRSRGVPQAIDDAELERRTQRFAKAAVRIDRRQDTLVTRV